jgi:hypothetical protein
VGDQRTVGRNVVIEVLTALLRNQLAAERGFTHLARPCEEHHFVGQISLDTVIKVAFHTRYFATFLKHFGN